MSKKKRYDFTDDDVVRVVRELAAERPDFIYTQQPEGLAHGVGKSTCSYVGARMGVKGGEGCIVGQALQRLGVKKKTLRRREGEPATAVLRRLGVDPGWVHNGWWLNRVQAHQDMGNSWGYCVTATDGDV